MARLLDLKKRLSENADAAGALAQLTEFAALITTGVTLTGGVLTIPIILSQASKTASSLSKLATLFLEDHKAGSRTQLNPAERADDIFYVFAQRSYMEAVTKLADKLPARRAKVDKVQHTSIVLRIESAIVKPDRAEASFQFGWTSNSGPLQLFDSYKGWMGTILVAAGIKEEIATKWLQDVEQLARKNLFRELVARGEDRQWMVHYQLLSTTTTILDVLRGFIPSNIGPTDAIWDKYLDKLVERPKLAIWGEETEHVSISQLFVEPAYGYSRFSINGASTPGNLAGSVSIKKFLVGLLSDRRPSTELTFVMGGPGSGKTSLMEVFCAEVAASRQLSLILVPAKRLNPNRPLFAEIQSFLAGNGFASIAESLATTNNVVIVIDGFDELAHATLSTLETFFRAAQDLVRDHASVGVRIVLSGRPTLFAANDVTIPAGSNVVTLHPFDGPRVVEWSRLWRKATGGSFEGSIYLQSDSADLRELASQPMLLYLLAKMHEDSRPIPATFGTARGVRSHIYSQILDWVCARQEHKKVPNALNVPLRRFMQIAGLATHQSGQRTLHWSRFSRALEQAGLAEDPKESDAKVYSTVLSFAFNNVKERAWEFTHKSFGEALASEAIGRVLEDISEKGRSGEPWRMPLPSATKLWIETFGPHFLTKDILDFCSGWITTRGGGFARELVPRLAEIYQSLCGITAAAYIHEVAKACEVAAHSVLGNATRSWFAITNSTLLAVRGTFPSSISGIIPSIDFEQYRAGVYLSNLVSPISAGEAETLLKWSSLLVRSRETRPSNAYMKSLVEAGLLIRAHRTSKGDRNVIYRRSVIWDLPFDGRYYDLSNFILEATHERVESKRTTPLEQALSDVEATLQAGFESNAVEEMFRLADISQREKMTPERVDRLEQVYREMIARVRGRAEGEILAEMLRAIPVSK